MNLPSVMDKSMKLLQSLAIMNTKLEIKGVLG